MLRNYLFQQLLHWSQTGAVMECEKPSLFLFKVDSDIAMT